MRKYLFLILAAYLAWYAGPTLTKVFWFLPVADIAAALTPTNLLSQSFSFYVSFVVWMAVLWIVMDTTGLMFMLAGPQKYGETPAARFIKGLLAETCVLALIAAPVFWLAVAIAGSSIVTERMAMDGGKDGLWGNASVWMHGVWSVKYLWRIVLPLALPLHFVLHRHVKRAIARIAKPIIRFQNLSRAGRGGSARFAGILEEWSLQ